MIYKIAGVGLFLLQIVLIFSGVLFFGKYLNPILLLVISAAIPSLFIWLHLRSTTQPDWKYTPVFWQKAVWAFGGLLSVLVTYEEFRKACIKFNEPEKISDIITQVRTLFERFTNNEFPYTAIDIVGSHILQPIYMPLHWLPAGIATMFDLDIRWAGYILFAIAVTIFGWLLTSIKAQLGMRIIALLLPSITLWAFIIKAPADIMVSYELVVAAYYLLLAAGLATGRLWIVVVGIILCLLSRYTLVFWLPLFALLFFQEYKWKKSLLVGGVILAAFVLIFIIPFYMRDTELLHRGLSHYKGATVAEWTGYGDPPTSWTQENGITLAAHMKAFFTDEMAQRVANARLIQGAVLLLLFGAGLVAYQRWKHKIDIYTFSLIALYCFMFCYYFFAPLTFRYYYFSLIVVSAVVCGKLVLLQKPKAEGSQ